MNVVSLCRIENALLHVKPFSFPKNSLRFNIISHNNKRFEKCRKLHQCNCSNALFCFLSVMHNSLFPGSRLSGSVGSLPLTVDGADAVDPSGDHQEYLRELERIRTEIAGFQPIEQPLERLRSVNGKSSSLDDDPFTGDDYY